MTTEDLARLVRDTRAKQTEYFRNRDNGTLRESKDMERRLDAAVKEVLNPTGPGLFDAPCDHAWGPNPVTAVFRCEKCGATTNLPPRGQAGTSEKQPPNQGGG